MRDAAGKRVFGRAKHLLTSGGFTLIELIVVLGIAGGLMGYVATRLGGSPLNLMRQESVKLIRVVKYAYFQAATFSQYYRIVFDLDEQTYVVEQSASPVQVIQEGDVIEERRKRNEEKEQQGMTDASSEEAPPPQPGGFAESEDEVVDKTTLPPKIKLVDAYVIHQKEKAEKGKVYLYFFPRGQTEFAVLHFADTEKEEEFMTLIVNPLTGNVEIRNEYVEYEDVLSEMEKS